MTTYWSETAPNGVIVSTVLEDQASWRNGGSHWFTITVTKSGKIMESHRRMLGVDAKKVHIKLLERWGGRAQSRTT